MLEVESKFRSPGNDKVEKALVKLGAKKISGGPMEDIYFSHPARDFGKTDEALRLRKMDGGAELTYKGPRMNIERAKGREEITIGAENPLAAQMIVERLGFEEFCIVKKTRSSYLFDKLRVELDDVEGLGEFVELEVLTESPERGTELLETIRKELSLEKLEQRTYLELILEKREAQKGR